VNAITVGNRHLSKRELTGLLAMSMALAALGIDLMLPAFGAMRADLGLPSDSTALAGPVTAYFVGLAVGQLVMGPVADRFGRKPVLFIGFGIYSLGALAATVAPSLEWLLFARLVWGIGASGPRVVILAVIRDLFSGDRMSRAMSTVMAIFVIVPVLAPTIGAAVITVVSWRWLFAFCMFAALLVTIWAVRLPETLHPEHQIPLRLDSMRRAAVAVITTRRTVTHMFAMTALYAAFASYIGSSEIIFVGAYDQGERYPLIFGGVAALMGVVMFVNSRIVERVGARRLTKTVLAGYVAAAGLLAAVTLGSGGLPPLPILLVGLVLMLGSHALLIPNLNAIAMAPVGHVAGTASAIIGTVQIACGALLGSMLDRAFDGTVRPIALGFFGFGVVALILVYWSGGRRARKGQPVTGTPPRATLPTDPAEQQPPAHPHTPESTPQR